MYDAILARKLRLAVVTNVFDQGLLDEGAARELLARPLSPGDSSTIYDDSALLGDPDGLEKIANSAPEPVADGATPTGDQPVQHPTQPLQLLRPDIYRAADRQHCYGGIAGNFSYYRLHACHLPCLRGLVIACPSH